VVSTAVSMEFDPPCALEAAARLSAEEKQWFVRAMRVLEQAGVPFMVAGAFGLYHHTGFWRGTKDLDLLVLPAHREIAIEAVRSIGLRDLFDQEPYDREWIFRATREGVIVDLIWKLANKEDEIDPQWLDRSSPGELFGVPVRCVSAADICWMKLFVFQRSRCDWPDIINVVRGTRGNLDWDHLLAKVGRHWRLLCALTNIFDWLCPPERHFIPESFRRQLDERLRANMDRDNECRNDLFDTRPWLTDPGAGSSAAAPIPTQN
jgi:hypothetical protein